MNDTKERTDLTTTINRVEYTFMEMGQAQLQLAHSKVESIKPNIASMIYDNYYLTGHKLTVRPYHKGTYGVFNGCPDRPLYVLQ